MMPAAKLNISTRTTCERRPFYNFSVFLSDPALSAAMLGSASGL